MSQMPQKIYSRMTSLILIRIFCQFFNLEFFKWKKFSVDILIESNVELQELVNYLFTVFSVLSTFLKQFSKIENKLKFMLNEKKNWISNYIWKLWELKNHQ